MNKFKVGDKVKDSYGHEFTVSSISGGNGKYFYHITDSNGSYTFNENDLSLCKRNKFEIGDIVLCNGVEYMIAAYISFSAIGPIFYDLTDIYNGKKLSSITEAVLTLAPKPASPITNTMNQIHAHIANQNNRAMLESDLSDKKSKTNAKCECGAHKVKDSRHAQWCEIKDL